VVLPITTGGNFARTAGFACRSRARDENHRVIRCDQPAPSDLGARTPAGWKACPPPSWDEVLAKLAPLFE